MNDEAARQGRPDTSTFTGPDDTNGCGRLVLLASAIAVELERIAELPEVSPLLRRCLLEQAAQAESRRTAA